MKIDGLKILIGKKITDAMVTSNPLAEPSAGETAWAAGTAYAIGDLRIRATTHRIYKCSVAHTSTAGLLPEADPTRWTDFGPTNRWAAFDNLCNTQSKSTGTLTMVLRPGFFSSLGLYNLTGGTAAVTVKDAPGGTVIFSKTTTLYENPLGYLDWVSKNIRTKSKLIFENITPHPNAELTVTLTAAAGVAVGVGMVLVGNFLHMLQGASFGGTEYGATAEMTDYTRIKDNGFGEMTIKPGHKAQGMRIDVVMPQTSADYAIEIISRALGVPALCVATSAPGYSGLTCYGLISGPVKYVGHSHATFSGFVQGLV